MVEMLFYIAIFSILALALINSLMTMTKAFKQISIHTDLIQSSSILERISRDIRQAYGINTISAGDLKLNTTDELGNNKTVRFLLSGFDVQLFEDDVLIGNLNTPNVEVTSLVFTEITTTTGKAIKINLSTRSVKDQTGRIEDFYDTLVLRGVY